MVNEKSPVGPKNKSKQEVIKDKIDDNIEVKVETEQKDKTNENERIFDVVGKAGDNKTIEELYGSSKREGHWIGSYEERKQCTIYSNDNSDISIGMYDVDVFPGGHDAMLYYNGFYISRKDGTYNRGPELCWRNSTHTWPGVKSIERVKLENNKVFAELVYSDGHKEFLEIEREKLPPIYRIYRNNKSYEQFFEGMDSLHGEHKIAVKDNELKTQQYIQKPGEQIKDNKSIKLIPYDAIVITDKAAIESLSEIRNKMLIRIDKLMHDNFTTNSMEFLLKRLNHKPKDINIFLPNVVDHPEIDAEDIKDETTYANYLKKIIQDTYKDIKDLRINLVKDKEILKNGDMNIIDRHAADLAGNEIYESWNTIKLPLYENEDGIRSLKENNLRIIDEAIKKAEKDMEILWSDKPRDRDFANKLALQKKERGEQSNIAVVLRNLNMFKDLTEGQFAQELIDSGNIGELYNNIHYFRNLDKKIFFQLKDKFGRRVIDRSQSFGGPSKLGAEVALAIIKEAGGGYDDDKTIIEILLKHDQYGLTFNQEILNEIKKRDFYGFNKSAIIKHVEDNMKG